MVGVPIGKITLNKTPFDNSKYGVSTKRPKEDAHRIRLKIYELGHRPNGKNQTKVSRYIQRAGNLCDALKSRWTYCGIKEPYKKRM